MSTRKHIRAILRGQAEKIGAKASKYVNREFDRIQIKKYGIEQREINKETGTRKKSTWRARKEFAIAKAQERKERQYKKRRAKSL